MDKLFSEEINWVELEKLRSINLNGCRCEICVNPLFLESKGCCRKISLKCSNKACKK